MAFASSVDMYALENISIMPRSIPPRNAPGIEPIPPNTAAVNAFMPGIEPVVGTSVGYDEHSSTPAIAASPEPIANVIDIVASTFMPISCAAPLSSEHARIALPVLVFSVNNVSPSMITMHVIIVIIVVHDTES